MERDFYSIGRKDFLLMRFPGYSLYRISEISFQDEIYYYQGFYEIYKKYQKK